MVLIMLVFIMSLRGEGVGPSTKEKTLSLPSWILGCTEKSDALVESENHKLP